MKTDRRLMLLLALLPGCLGLQLPPEPADDSGAAVSDGGFWQAPGDQPTQSPTAVDAGHQQAPGAAIDATDATGPDAGTVAVVGGELTYEPCSAATTYLDPVDGAQQQDPIAIGECNWLQINRCVNQVGEPWLFVVWDHETQAARSFPCDRDGDCRDALHVASLACLGATAP